MTKLKLNMGSGFKRYPGFLNVDKWSGCKPDIVWDLDTFPWPFESNSVSHILFNHSFGYIGEISSGFVKVMQEIYRVCVDQAIIEIVVFHPSSEAFTTDPFLVRSIYPELFHLFSLRLNLDCKAKGLSQPQYAIQCEVDFEVQRTEYKYGDQHVVKEELNKNTFSKLYNGDHHATEIYIQLKAIKPTNNIHLSGYLHQNDGIQNLDLALERSKLKRLIDSKRFDEALDHAIRYADISKWDEFSLKSLAFLKAHFGLIDEAIQLNLKALEFNPNDPETNCNLGNLYITLKDFEKAELFFLSAIKNNPSFAEGFNGLGLTYKYLGNYTDAISSFSEAISLNTRHAEAYYNRGNLYFQLNNFDSADKDYLSAIKFRPDYAEAFSARGNIHYSFMEYDAAIINYTIALQINSELPEALNNRIVTYTHVENFEKALSDSNKLISIKPDYPEAYFNRAALFFARNDFDNAIKFYDIALAAGFPLVEIEYNKSFIYLIKGDLARGFSYYESRLKKRNPLGLRSYSKPRWDGKINLDGKVLLVYYEQGLGDTIQFSRYVKLLAVRGCQILFEPQQSLVSILASLDRNISFSLNYTQEDAFDFHISLLSLPRALGTTLDTVPSEERYLFANSQMADFWRSKLGDSGFKIALTWRCSKNHDSYGRSFPISFFQELCHFRSIRLINVQKDITEEDKRSMESMGIENFNDLMNEDQNAFLDTAAILTCCDLLITCDASVAHLAGALGVKVWLIIKHSPHWVWMLDRETSPWYPSLRIFRQSAPGNWESAFSEIYRALKDQLEKVNEKPKI